MGMETCCTLGLLNAEQAKQLKDAGLTAYNHNLDTSPEHYPNIVSTRVLVVDLNSAVAHAGTRFSASQWISRYCHLWLSLIPSVGFTSLLPVAFFSRLGSDMRKLPNGPQGTYADRLETLANVREAGISVCCGGILGIAETQEDRVGRFERGFSPFQSRFRVSERTCFGQSLTPCLDSNVWWPRETSLLGLANSKSFVLWLTVPLVAPDQQIPVNHRYHYTS